MLGVGYPEDFLYGYGEEQGIAIALWTGLAHGKRINLKYPKCLQDAIIPKYRLVLERVK